MAAHAPPAPIPPWFLLSVFIVAAFAGILIAYLGITGAIGYPIP
ncbi:MAG TPA: hypothetical protein VEH57_09500 [Thermoplasmata archaeon]|nr:hypothetical protein [Thermoplasmata archaeon]